MNKKFNSVYQFKITLEGVEPNIWRRLQVPGTYSFWDLHVAIQDAMGWTDSHLHQFSILNPATRMIDEIGIPDDEFEMDYEVLPGWEKKIAKYFSAKNSRAQYVYDFGDNWMHEVLLEEILPREKGVAYPVCLDGRRACPPEDCGGPEGYEEFLEIIMEPGDERHEELLEWAGGDFEPERFIPGEVIFDDPAERLKTLED